MLFAQFVVFAQFVLFAQVLIDDLRVELEERHLGVGQAQAELAEVAAGTVSLRFEGGPCHKAKTAGSRWGLFLEGFFITKGNESVLVQVELVGLELVLVHEVDS